VPPCLIRIEERTRGATRHERILQKPLVLEPRQRTLEDGDRLINVATLDRVRLEPFVLRGFSLPTKRGPDPSKAMTIKPASPAPPPPPASPKEDQVRDEKIPWIAILMVLIFAFAFLSGLSDPAHAGAYIYSAFCLLWLVFLTIWIKKIKDRQTEMVLVQTMSLQALQEILEQIKKQNV
jgi:hypothetical protein